MGNETFLLAGDDTVAVLTLARAHCLDIAGKHALLDAVNALSQRENLRSLVINANHPQAWLVNVAELVDMAPADARAFSRRGHELADAVARLPVPVIAAVDAPALGGGCELVLACDIALAGPLARFGQIEALGGVLPAFGGTWRLARRVGYQRAMRMLFTAEVVDSEVARAIGLVLEVAPSAELMDRARALAVQIARTSRQSVAAIKRVVDAGANAAPPVISALEEEAFSSLFGTEDQQARMRAFLAGQAAGN